MVFRGAPAHSQPGQRRRLLGGSLEDFLLDIGRLKLDQAFQIAMVLDGQRLPKHGRGGQEAKAGGEGQAALPGGARAEAAKAEEQQADTGGAKTKNLERRHPRRLVAAPEAK